jgi:aryl-alcohol dehydrogenase-like predicted oxidoreductase
VAHLRQNLAVADIKLSDAVLKKLDRIGRKDAA